MYLSRVFIKNRSLREKIINGLLPRASPFRAGTVSLVANKSWGKAQTGWSEGRILKIPSKIQMIAKISYRKANGIE